jgi:uncharacterized phage protein gp47/JayE
VPEFSLIPESLEALFDRLCAHYVELSERAGWALTDLSPASPVTLHLRVMAEQFYQLYALLDRGVKSNFATYSYGALLDNLAANKAVYRKPEQSAQVTLRFQASTLSASAIPIPAGTRVRTEDDLAFSTLQYAEIRPMETIVDVPAQSLLPGKVSNGILPGELKLFIDKPPYIQAVENTDVSSGGDDVESDDDLTYRYLMEWARHNTAGSRLAYIYWVKTFRGDVGTVEAYRSAPGEVTVLLLMEDASPPTQSFIEQLYAWLNDDEKRPLGDDLVIRAPEEIDYSLSLTYWILTKDAPETGRIQARVNLAVDEYIRWQRAIGRNLRPHKLVQLIEEAGARCEIASPGFTVIPPQKIARLIGTPAVTYGGWEDE